MIVGCNGQKLDLQNDLDGRRLLKFTKWQQFPVYFTSILHYFSCIMPLEAVQCTWIENEKSQAGTVTDLLSENYSSAAVEKKKTIPRRKRENFMRKKSHIALSVFLVSELRLKELDFHRKAFYLGSIQPDLNPRMFSEPHQFDETWEKVQKLILQIEAETRDGDYSRRAIWMQTGIVMHYLADYFTFPHNTCFDGSLRGHCMHESELKYLLRAYLCTSEARVAFERQKLRAGQIHTAEQLCTYIEMTHDAYMRESYHSVLNDCR